MDTVRDNIEREIHRLLRAIDIQLAFGEVAEANRLRNRIGDLERQKQDVNQNKGR